MKNENFNQSLIIDSVFLSGFGNILLRSINFFSAFLILHWLTVFQFGIYRLVLAAIDLFSSFFLNGVEPIIINDISSNLNNNREKSREVFSAFYVTNILIGLFLFLFFIEFDYLIDRWLSVGPDLIRLSSFIFLFAPLEMLAKANLYIFLDFKKRIYFQAIKDLLRIIILGIYFLYANVTVEGVISSPIISSFATFIFFEILHIKNNLLILPKLSHFKNLLYEIFLNHGKWGFFEDIVLSAGKNIRPFVIKILVGVEAVAIFSVAQSFVSYISSFFPLGDVLTVTFPRIDSVELISKLNLKIKYATLAYVIIAVISMLVVPSVVLLFLPKYVSSLPIFYILILTLPQLGFRSVIGPLFNVFRAQKIIFEITVMRLFFITILGITLTHFFGIFGSAIELFLVSLFLNFAYFFAIKKIIPEWNFSMKDLFIHRSDFIFLYNLLNKMIRSRLSTYYL